MSRSTEISDVECLKESTKALLCLIDNKDEIWVPKSVLEDGNELNGPGDRGTLVVAEWFAKKTDELQGYV